MPTEALCLHGVNRGRAHAAQDVHLERHRLDVIRIDAIPPPTQMIEGESGRDRSDEKLVHESMSDLRALHRIPEGDHAVAQTIVGTAPQPAIAVDFDAIYQAIEGGAGGAHWILPSAINFAVKARRRSV